MKRLLILVLIFLWGCSPTGRTTKIDNPGYAAVGDKIVAFDAPREPWVYEIQNRLQAKGFKVLRWKSTAKVTKKYDENTTKEFNESEARYVVFIDGRAYVPNGPYRRCSQGGYWFDYFNIDLVDVRMNRTLVNISGHGFTENCTYMKDPIFANIVDAINDKWNW